MDTKTEAAAQSEQKPHILTFTEIDAQAAENGGHRLNPCAFCLKENMDTRPWGPDHKEICIECSRLDQYIDGVAEMMDEAARLADQRLNTCSFCKQENVDTRQIAEKEICRPCALAPENEAEVLAWIKKLEDEERAARGDLEAQIRKLLGLPGDAKMRVIDLDSPEGQKLLTETDAKDDDSTPPLLDEP